MQRPVGRDASTQYLFNLHTANGANKLLGQWGRSAGIEKQITWNCTHQSFSILLLDAKVDADEESFKQLLYEDFKVDSRVTSASFQQMKEDANTLPKKDWKK